MGYQNKAKAKPGFGGVEGVEGPPGPPGPGFNFSATGDFDVQTKRLTNVADGTGNSDAVTKKQIDAKVNKVMTDHMDANYHVIKNVSLGTDDDAFPLFHGKQIFMTTNGTFNAKNQGITNLVTNTKDPTSAVNMATLSAVATSSSSSSSGNLDLQNKFNVLNSKQRNLAGLKTHYDSLVSFEEVNRNFLSRVEEFPMGVQMDMNHHSITNLPNPVYGHEASTKDYADTKLAKTGGRITGPINMGTFEISNLAEPSGLTNATTKRYVDGKETLLRNETSQEVVKIQALLDAKIDIGEIDQKNKKIVNLGTPTAGSDAATKDFVEKSHVSQSGLQENVFRYHMTDVNESSSESNNKVLGILKFSRSPHTIFKNAYKMEIGKDGNNQYISRIGFNFNPMTTGEYTYVVEYFPPTQTNVSVDCVSTSLNVTKQIKKKFPEARSALDYFKDVVQVHKWQMTTPDYLMIDLHCDGDASSPAKGIGWLIVYGVTGTHTNVSSRVLDAQSIISGGRMVMQIPLDMGGNVISNLPLATTATQAASKEFVEKALWNKTTVANFVDGFIQEESECFYSIDRGGKDEVVFDSTRAISTLFDKSLSGLNATEASAKFAPKLSTTKNQRRLFMNFSGTQRLLSLANLNPGSGNDIVNVFILFRLTSHAGRHANFRNGLFSNYAAGWNRLVCFTATTNNLLISGTKKDGSEFLRGDNVQVTSNKWQLNKWCCLSVHWDVPGGAGKSSCWANGKKLKTFQAISSSGSPKTTLGDLIPTGLAGLSGDIQIFVLFEGKQMSDFLIKAHHKMICERYGVDHEEISFP